MLFMLDWKVIKQITIQLNYIQHQINGTILTLPLLMMSVIVLSFHIPVRTLMAPCTALTSPLTSISIRSVKSWGHASGQSQ